MLAEHCVELVMLSQRQKLPEVVIACDFRKLWPFFQDGGKKE
jgi:hypothetical protein